MSVFVPPRVALGIAKRNLKLAILAYIAEEPDPSNPRAQRTREQPVPIATLKDAFERLGATGEIRNAVMRELLVDKLVRTDGSRVWVDPADVRRFVAKHTAGGIA